MSDSKIARALLAPSRVALVGASADPSKNTARPQRYLRAHGYTGTIVPIKNSAAECLGEKAYASIDEAPDGIEHALIMVPGKYVLGVIEQCVRKRIPVALIYSEPGQAACRGTGRAGADAGGTGRLEAVRGAGLAAAGGTAPQPVICLSEV